MGRRLLKGTKGGGGESYGGVEQRVRKIKRIEE
jgi:hypothetical protein